jgi:magnesium transporter
MINRYTHKEITWIDLVQPTAEEVKTISDEFSIYPTVANELTSPSVKSRIELYKNYIYLILHFPVFKHSHSAETKQEVDFIIGENFVITARYDTIDAIEKYAKVFEVSSILERDMSDSGTGAGGVFFGIVKEIYQSLFYELEYIENWLSKTEEDIFHGKEREMVIALSEISRTLLNFKKSTDFHREVLESLDIFGRKVFDDHFSYHARRILDEYHKVQSTLRNNLEFVAELRETNNSLLSTKQNEIMKTLTIMAFTTFPLTLLAAIFSMETVSTPLLGHPYDFWIIIGGMATATIIFFSFFKYKKWF